MGKKTSVLRLVVSNVGMMRAVSVRAISGKDLNMDHEEVSRERAHQSEHV